MTTTYEMTLKEFIASKTAIEAQDDITKYSFQPGDGYRYEIFVIPVNKPLGGGRLGGIEQGYLIINTFTGLAYLFSLAQPYLTTDYVAEHLFKYDNVTTPNVHAITALIAWVLNRDTDATVEKMNLDSDLD